MSLSTSSPPISAIGDLTQLVYIGHVWSLCFFLHSLVRPNNAFCNSVFSLFNFRGFYLCIASKVDNVVDIAKEAIDHGKVSVPFLMSQKDTSFYDKFAATCKLSYHSYAD